MPDDVIEEAAAILAERNPGSVPVPWPDLSDGAREGYRQDARALAAAGLLAVPAVQPDSPEVVVLCGSMKYATHMDTVAAQETAAGRIVLMPHPVSDEDSIADGSDRKAMLDGLHRAKIRMAALHGGRVIVVSDASGYYGESTAREIRYAGELGLPVESRNVASPAAPADDTAITRAIHGAFCGCAFVDLNCANYELVALHRAARAALAALREGKRQ